MKINTAWNNILCLLWQFQLPSLQTLACVKSFFKKEINQHLWSILLPSSLVSLQCRKAPRQPKLSTRMFFLLPSFKVLPRDGWKRGPWITWVRLTDWFVPCHTPCPKPGKLWAAVCKHKCNIWFTQPFQNSLSSEFWTHFLTLGSFWTCSELSTEPLVKGSISHTRSWTLILKFAFSPRL